MSIVKAGLRFKARKDGSKVCFYVIWADTGEAETITQREYLLKRLGPPIRPCKELVVLPIHLADNFDYNRYKALLTRQS